MRQACSLLDVHVRGCMARAPLTPVGSIMPVRALPGPHTTMITSRVRMLVCPFLASAGVVSFGASFKSFEKLPGGRVRVHFEGQGAEPVECDVLVGEWGAARGWAHVRMVITKAKTIFRR